MLKELKNKCPYIIQYFDDFGFLGIFRCIITEYCPNGDLDDSIIEYKKSGQNFDLNQINFWAIQIMEGLVFLHELKIIHRDIKPK